MRSFVIFVIGGLLFALGLTACVTSCEKNQNNEASSTLVI